MNRLKIINIANQRFHSGTELSVDTHKSFSDEIWFLLRMNGKAYDKL